MKEREREREREREILCMWIFEREREPFSKCLFRYAAHECGVRVEIN